MRHAIVFIEMSAGMITLVRIFAQIRKNSLVSNEAMTKIVAAFFVCECLLALVPARSMIAFTICWSVPIAVASFLPTIIRRRRRQHFLRHRIWILNCLILNTRLGIGLRRALVQTSDRADFYIKTRLRQLHDRLITETKGSSSHAPMDPVLHELYETLWLCESEAHLTVQRLVNYRQKIEIYEEFRRKSDQALHQLRAQAYVLTGLYAGLLLFVISRFGFTQHERAIMLSAMLFLLGVFITLRQGRNIKWSV